MPSYQVAGIRVRASAWSFSKGYDAGWMMDDAKDRWLLNLEQSICSTRKYPVHIPFWHLHAKYQSVHVLCREVQI